MHKMYISSFSIENYKSYLKTKTIELKPGFNLFVGKNNVGKTSLLEALSCDFSNKPHLSESTVPFPNGRNVNVNGSRVNFEFALGWNKFLEWASDNKNNANLPYLTGVGNISDSQNIDYINTRISHFGENLYFEFKQRQGEISYANLQGLAAHENSGGNIQLIPTQYDNSKKIFKVLGDTVSTGYNFSFWTQLSSKFISKIYCFKAERFNVGKSAFGKSNILKTNASNLPEVLTSLSANPSKFKRYNTYLNRVFPEIYEITVNPISDKELEILTWIIDPKTERQDLAIPLSESGTGVGQVLAMLYVVLEKEPQIIIIDELQSFLHPGAVRKLIEIFKENLHHQYIIATHSPTVISSCNPETITLIQHEGSETILKTIDKNQSKQLNEYLTEIGARLSDVFGADNILWVEGPTEELCVPMIIEKLLKRSLMGTNVIGVINTGDLEGRDKKRIYEIYSTLSKSNSLMPPSIGFVFDREGKKGSEIKDLEKASNGLVHFLSKRMYENYLLNADAISFVVNSIEGFSENPITKETVEGWIEKNREDNKYWKDTKKEKFETNWRKGIHAGEFLKKLFYDLSEQRVEFRKTEHSVRLTEWVIENSKQDLNELTDLLENILDQKT